MLRWSSPERKTYSRVGRFSFYGKRKGKVFADFLREGDPDEVDVDWFAGDVKVVEIV